MALSVKHKFASLKSDGIDTSLVQPSDWNDEHDITLGANTLLGRGTGAGAAQELSIDVIGMPIGVPVPWPAAAGTEPSNYILLYGQAISRTTYAALFALWGTTYGVGDGSTTFGVPDLRDRAVIGKGDMGGVAANRITSGVSGFSTSVLGNVGGAQSRQNTMTVSGSATGALSVSVNGTASNASSTISRGDQGSGSSVVTWFATYSVSASGFTSGSLGVSASGTSSVFSIVQPVIVFNWICKATRT